MTKTGKPFWDQKKKLYELADCPCGGTQDMGEIRVLYTGYGDYGRWNVYCNCCMRSASAEKELDAVERWNRGEYE